MRMRSESESKKILTSKLKIYFKKQLANGQNSEEGAVALWLMPKMQSQSQNPPANTVTLDSCWAPPMNK